MLLLPKQVSWFYERIGSTFDTQSIVCVPHSAHVDLTGKCMDVKAVSRHPEGSGYLDDYITGEERLEDRD